MEGLTNVIEAAPFCLIATVIRKDKLAERYASPANPYILALEFCLERLRHQLSESETVHVVFESRGAFEDATLELEFRRVCDQKGYPFEPVFASKKSNSTGLQIARSHRATDRHPGTSARSAEPSV